MNCGLTKGRTEIICRDNIGGVKNVYLFPYVDYPYNLIVGQRGAELTDFPSSTLYKYAVVNGNFSEDIVNDEKGVSYKQSLSFTLFKQDLLTTNELKTLSNIDFRYIVEFNDGKLKIGGLFNGAKVEALKMQSGGGKASLNGYDITIKSEEEYQAAFIDSLDIILGGSFLLLEDATNLLLEDATNLILE